MKKLSDYKGEDAIELWADLLEPLTNILGDPKIAAVVQSGQPKMMIAKAIMSEHKAEAEEILLRIDPEPLDGLNIIVRLVSVIVEIGQREEIRGFFGYAAQEKTESASSGSATVNTGESAK
ncbi:MAG: hypothetical protein IK078_09165 [Lachnospiraceae bacterium]|nr:hypothetical protein [Lachnospiraceae bacterium]